MMIYLIRNNKGLTLVEVMFSAMIGLIIMGMCMILYIGANKSMVVGLALAEINSDARLAMDRIVRDVRRATDIEATRTVSGTTYVTGDDELIIEVPAVDSNRDVIDSTFDYIIYALDSTDDSLLRMVIDPDNVSIRPSADQIVADNIETFTLSSGGVGLSSLGSLSSVTALEIGVTVSKEPLPNKTVQQTINSDVELRNSK